MIMLREKRARVAPPPPRRGSVGVALSAAVALAGLGLLAFSVWRRRRK